VGTPTTRLGTIYQRRPVKRGGGVGQSGQPRTGGSAMNRTSRKNIFHFSGRKNLSWPDFFWARKNCFLGVSVVRIGVRRHPPMWIAIYFGPDRNIFRGPDVRDGGGCVSQTDNVGQGGIEKVSFRSDVFDDPLHNHIILLPFRQ